jgi:hypothetical protein
MVLLVVLVFELRALCLYACWVGALSLEFEPHPQSFFLLLVIFQVGLQFFGGTGV